VPYGIVFEPRSKDVYVDCERADEIWRVRPDGSKKAYPIPTEQALPRELTLGRDGQVYASLFDVGAVAQLDPATGQVQFWRARLGTFVGGAAFDTSDRLWFTLPRSGTVAQMDRTVGRATEYSLPSRAYPTLVVAGPSGELYASDVSRDSVSAFKPPVAADPGQRVFSRDLYKRTTWKLTLAARGALTVDVLDAPGTAVTLTAKPKVSRTLNLVGHQRFRVASRSGTKVALSLDVRALEPQTVVVRVSPVQ
jgi:streptogramin lyase